ncbi:MAG: hypothetical protein E4H01_00640 [Lysobacterales bacterium]|nr:MAG: hypothetical protein E4H01_00640 [Xanthomonadales bacterium]
MASTGLLGFARGAGIAGAQVAGEQITANIATEAMELRSKLLGDLQKSSDQRREVTELKVQGKRQEHELDVQGKGFKHTQGLQTERLRADKDLAEFSSRQAWGRAKFSATRADERQDRGNEQAIARIELQDNKSIALQDRAYDQGLKLANLKSPLVQDAEGSYFSVQVNGDKKTQVYLTKEDGQKVMGPKNMTERDKVRVNAFSDAAIAQIRSISSDTLMEEPVKRASIAGITTWLEGKLDSIGRTKGGADTTGAPKPEPTEAQIKLFQRGENDPNVRAMFAEKFGDKSAVQHSKAKSSEVKEAPGGVKKGNYGTFSSWETVEKAMRKGDPAAWDYAREQREGPSFFGWSKSNFPQSVKDLLDRGEE